MTIYKDIIKPLLSINQITIENLAVKMSAELNKKYTRSSLNGKFSRDTLTMKECMVIAKLINRHIEFVENSK